MQLQRLLAGRQQVAVVISGALSDGGILCSCGQTFDDSQQVEEHLVSKHKPQEGRFLVEDALKQALAALENRSTAYLALLDEASIGGGLRAKNLTCSDCGSVLADFQALKDHFLSSHAGRWRPLPNEANPANVLTRREAFASRKHKCWPIQYYCPIPGCRFHVGGRRWLASAKLLRQHYAKVHAGREKMRCGGCGDVFANANNLKRHKARKAGCGAGREDSRLNAGNVDKSEYLARMKRANPQNTSTSKPRRILPRPSAPHLSAAIALSQLGEQASTVQQADNEQSVATAVPVMSTQTSPPYLSQADAETQLSTLDEEADDFALELLTAETQTDPYLNTGVETQTEPASALAAAFSSSVSSSFDASLYTSETQTDEDIWLEATSTRHRQTQFDFQDVALCSNYTQTGKIGPYWLSCVCY